MATVSSEPDTSASQSEILHFIKSTFGTLEGIPCNCLVENKPKKKKKQTKIVIEDVALLQMASLFLLRFAMLLIFMCQKKS